MIINPVAPEIRTTSLVMSFQQVDVCWGANPRRCLSPRQVMIGENKQGHVQLKMGHAVDATVPIEIACTVLNSRRL
jgi:hypothetical protein